MISDSPAIDYVKKGRRDENRQVESVSPGERIQQSFPQE